MQPWTPPTPCRDGAISRWLLTYSLLGDRLLESAVYEHYDGVTAGRSMAKPIWTETGDNTGF